MAQQNNKCAGAPNYAAFSSTCGRVSVQRIRRGTPSLSQLLVFISLSCPASWREAMCCLTTSEPEKALLCLRGWGRRSYQALPGAFLPQLPSPPLCRSNSQDRTAALVVIVLLLGLSRGSSVTRGMASVANSKAKMGKGKQTRSLTFSWAFVFQFFTRLAIVISVSHVLFEDVSWQRVFCPPPDKGTVQKVIVLPSNQSLHEDLILEELEVFKVSGLFFFLFSFYSTLTFIISKSKAREEEEEEEEEEGELGHTTKAADRQKMGGNQAMDALQCSAAWSDGEHAYKQHRGNLFFVNAVLSQLRSLNCVIDLWSDLKAEVALNFDYKEEKWKNIYTRKLREKDIWWKAKMVKCAARNFEMAK